jgi:hypothetical protein
MALYKDANYLKQNTHSAFDALLTPGTILVNSGVCRCEGCGDEIAANKDDPLPPQNHHQHSTAQGRIRWRMIVCSVQK